jgi:hypothetical protein
MIKGMNSMFIAGLALLESVQDQLFQADDFCKSCLGLKYIIETAFLLVDQNPKTDLTV